MLEESSPIVLAKLRVPARPEQGDLERVVGEKQAVLLRQVDHFVVVRQPVQFVGVQVFEQFPDPGEAGGLARSGRRP